MATYHHDKARETQDRCWCLEFHGFDGYDPRHRQCDRHSWQRHGQLWWGGPTFQSCFRCLTVRRAR